MNDSQVKAVQVGDVIGPIEFEPISRLTLALFCGASNDHNPIHVDSDAAKAAGLDDVIGHGMLSMAYLGRLLLAWTSQKNVLSFDCRFVGLTRVGEIPVLTGEALAEFEQNGKRRVEVALTLKDQKGDTKVLGKAIINSPN